MVKGIGMLLILMVFASDVIATYLQQDSMQPKKGLSILLSARPVINWLSKKDSADNFMYSNVQLEAQYFYQRHMLGLGIGGYHQRYLTPVNGLPNTDETTRFSFAPFYSYRLGDFKRWKFYSGLAYVYNYDQRLLIRQSNIENTSKSKTTITEGMGLFLRVNYKFNRHFSMEMECSFYNTRMRQDVVETYPLTPSMSSLKSNYLVTQTFSLPSNLFFKYTF
jgi:hypothetical protein